MVSYLSLLLFSKRLLTCCREEHCLDFLRQSAMCHGDIGLITYIWRQDSLQPVVNATSHQCVNWEKLYDWSQDRAVDMLKPGWLVHPTKGKLDQNQSQAKSILEY